MYIAQRHPVVHLSIFAPSSVESDRAMPHLSTFEQKSAIR